MKLFAQHGHQPSDKIKRGLEEKVIDGVIISPRYVSPDKLNMFIEESYISSKNASLFIDLEFYATPTWIIRIVNLDIYQFGNILYRNEDEIW
ncbi:MAG: hypothetical protein MRJ65_16230 [Candidatus Brocadiaceae bacterium]|nr:hypothetical protein [Candidatus Brocadiaceae bacterium]